jgi:hypothetical protein
MPDSVGEARELWNESVDHEWAHSEEGVLLTRASIKLYQEYLPPGMKPAMPAFLRRALSDKYADMVEVPRSAFDLGANLGAAAGSLLTGTPLTHNVVSDQVMGALNTVVERVARDAFTARHETEPQMSDHRPESRQGSRRPPPPSPECKCCGSSCPSVAPCSSSGGGPVTVDPPTESRTVLWR